MLLMIVAAASLSQAQPDGNATTAATPPQNIIDALADAHLIGTACKAYLKLDPHIFEVEQHESSETREILAYAQEEGRRIAPHISKQVCLDRAREATDNLREFNYWLNLSQTGPEHFRLIVEGCRTVHPKLEFNNSTRSCWIADKTAKSLDSGFLVRKAN